ncbi:MAG: hypothetical protein IJ831_00650 [Spirochaetales bacterium]|nr:hypothetical protein [Spirochaetales bacterium]
MRRLLPLLILSAILIPLSASPLRVGIYRDVPEFLSNYTGDVAALSFSRRVSSLALDGVNYSRDEREFMDSREEELHRSLSKEMTYKEKSSFEYTAWYRSPVEFIELGRSDVLDEYLLRRDGTALEYLTLSKRLDLIIYFSFSGSGMILSKNMYIYLDGQVIEGPEGLILRRDPYSFFEEDVVFLLSNLFPSLALMDLSKVPRPYTAYVDKERLFVIDDKAVVESGIRAIRVVPHGYSERTLYLDVEEKSRVDLSEAFTQEEQYPLTIGAVPYGADITLLGESGEAPFFLEAAPSPAIFSVRENGFQASVLQLMGRDRLYISRLRPEWAGKEGEVKKAKRSVYRAIRNTLLALGANTVVKASMNLWPDRKSELRPYDDITLALGFMGMVSIFHNCYNYYSTAKDTYLQE